MQNGLIEEQKIEPEINNFELRSKKYFFTYSDCELMHDTILSAVKSAFISLGVMVLTWVVARELHEDGTRHHLHAYFEVNKTPDQRKCNAKLFDVAGHHPNISAVRSAKRVIRYVVKDENYITNNKEMVKDYCKKYGGSREDIGKEILEGKPLIQLAIEHPHLIFGYSKLRGDIQAFQADKAEISRAKGPVGIWIGGWSGVGKTHFSTVTLPALTGLACYDKPNNFRFWPGYNNEKIACCQDVDNSWAGCLEAFKQWADAYPFTGESKGGHFKTRLDLLVVTSNQTIDEWLTGCKVPDNSQIREPWIRRFREYWVQDRKEFESIIQEIIKFLKSNKSD